jgi:hypothetical protein
LAHHKFLTQNRHKTELDEGRIINHHESSTKPMVKVKTYTKEELVEKLGISLEEFERLKSPNFYRSIASKISLPLVRLYCATKFTDGDKFEKNTET